MDFPLATVAQFTDHLRALRKARGMTQADLGRLIGVSQSRIADIERDPGSVSVTFRVKRYAFQAAPATDGNRRLFSGTIDDVIRDIEAVRKIGVTALDFDFEAREAEKAIADMCQFKAEVMRRI